MLLQRENHLSSDFLLASSSFTARQASTILAEAITAKKYITRYCMHYYSQKTRASQHFSPKHMFMLPAYATLLNYNVIHKYDPTPGNSTDLVFR